MRMGKEIKMTIYDALSKQFDYVKTGDGFAEIPSENILECTEWLKNEAGYDYLEMITASDHNEKFLLVYTLINVVDKTDIIIKTSVPREKPEIDSLSNIWTGADFQEREIFDLMGIVFKGHKNLKRIVLWDGFEGHPQRKDFKDVI